jgi:hypothetical protein
VRGRRIRARDGLKVGVVKAADQNGHGLESPDDDVVRVPENAVQRVEQDKFGAREVDVETAHATLKSLRVSESSIDATLRDSGGRGSNVVTGGQRFRPVLGIVRPACNYDSVDVSAADIARITAGNVRVPQAEFVALWQGAELFHDEQLRRGVPDWHGAGVVETCRWLANAIVRPETGGPGHLAPSPVTGRLKVAYEELIEAECLAAEKLAACRPVPAWLEHRPGWIEAVAATLNWAWRRFGRPPLDTVGARWAGGGATTDKH